MEVTDKINGKNAKIRIVVLVLVVGIFIGGLSGYLFGYYLFISENENIQNQLTILSDNIEEMMVEAASNNEDINDIIVSLEEHLSQLQSQIGDLWGGGYLKPRIVRYIK